MKATPFHHRSHIFPQRIPKVPRTVQRIRERACALCVGSTKVALKATPFQRKCHTFPHRELRLLWRLLLSNARERERGAWFLVTVHSLVQWSGRCSSCLLFGDCLPLGWETRLNCFFFSFVMKISIYRHKKCLSSGIEPKNWLWGWPLLVCHWDYGESCKW